MDDDGASDTEAPARAVKTKELTAFQRVFAYGQLVALEDEDGKLPYGALTNLGKKLAVQRQTVAAIWKAGKAARAAGESEEEAVKSKKRKTGRHIKYDKELLMEEIRAIPMKERQTLEQLAQRTGVPKTTLHRYAHFADADNDHKRLIIHHTSSLKPRLTEQHKYERVLFVLDFIDFGTGMFVDMYDYVHVDEKWFYIDTVLRRIWLVIGEEAPPRTTQSKSHILKIMFLCAVARPRPGFNGLVGIWPVAKKKPAPRRSRNRARGTLEWKIVNMNKDVYINMMLEKVLPAIKAKCPPAMRNHVIYIQQDNARPHNDFTKDSALLRAKNEELGIVCVPANQPAQSPDLNALDLGFFASLQSRQLKQDMPNVDGLVERVIQCFAEYPPEKLNRTFLTLQSVMNEILKHGGDNHFKIPHIGKQALEAAGVLPLVLAADPCWEEWAWSNGVDE